MAPGLSGTRSRIQAIFFSQFLWVHLICVSRCRKWHWPHLASTIALPSPAGRLGGGSSLSSSLPATRPGLRIHPFGTTSPCLSVSDTSAVAGLPSVKVTGVSLLWKPFPIPCTLYSPGGRLLTVYRPSV